MTGLGLSTMSSNLLSIKIPKLRGDLSANSQTQETKVNPQRKMK